jgi:hypothetical protein
VSEIGLIEVAGAGQDAHLLADAPFEDENGTVRLHFLVSARNPDSLEALRDARRALLREERTRGRDTDEPSLEDAVFSSTEILWEVAPAQRTWCLQKLEELRRRANQLLSEVERD